MALCWAPARRDRDLYTQVARKAESMSQDTNSGSSTTEVYVAVVVRHDGPVPGLCSTLELSLVVAGVSTTSGFRELDDSPMVKLVLKPIGVAWKGGFGTLSAERSRYEAEGEPAGSAITRAARFLHGELARLGLPDAHLVPVAWPGTHDASHILHYFRRHSGLVDPFRSSTLHTPEELFALCSQARRRLTANPSARRPARVARHTDALDTASPARR